MRKYLLLLFVVFWSGCVQKTKWTEFYQKNLASSVIELTVRGELYDTLYAQASVVTNIPRGGNKSKLLAITKPGVYYITVKVDRPTTCALYLETKYNVFVSPYDTTKIKISPTKEAPVIKFKGNGKEINEFYLKKRSFFDYADIRFPINTRITSKSTYSSAKQLIDSIAARELAFLEKYPETERLPKWFLDFEKSQIVYMRDYFKTSLPHANEALGLFEDDLPKDYFDYIDDVVIVNPKAVLSAHYIWFLGSYFNMDLPVDSYKDLGGRSRVSLILSHQLSRSKNELNGIVRDVYHRYNFSSIVKYYTDSLTIDSIAREFGLSDYKGLIAEAGTSVTDHVKWLNLNKGDTIPDFYLVNHLDSLVKFRDYRNKVLYLNFWATWCGPCIKNIPELNSLVYQYKGDDRIEFMNICMGSKKSTWLTDLVRYKLQGTNLFANQNWSLKLKSYFNIKGIPHYVIVDRNNVLYENFSNKAPMVKTKIDELLGNLTNKGQ